ncbi:MAG TPA: nitroreductase family deazaflavin-dependent oxidoreductase [Myxococcota bacterium]|nr:nitroreductase family deazaflavin-dependent oxidoreductase [Myxococcota bacterium]
MRERFAGEPLAPALDADAQAALARDRVADITTRGRKSGLPRRTEIWFFRVQGRLYLTGSPGRDRHWLRNLEAEPHFTLHLKESARRDLPAFARIVTGSAERGRVLARILEQIDGNTRAEWAPGASAAELDALRANHARIAADRASELPRWEAESPLVEVRL